MKLSTSILTVCIAVALVALLSSCVTAQRSGATALMDWPLHNLDLAGSRFSKRDQINTANPKTLQQATRLAIAPSARASTCSLIRSWRSNSPRRKMKWYYQQIHHDVWDYDSGTPPILFEMTVRGQSVACIRASLKPA